MKTIRIRVRMAALAAAALLSAGCGAPGAITREVMAGFVPEAAGQTREASVSGTAFCLEDVPAYSGKPYEVINDNVPYFTGAELTEISFEDYSDLDFLGRCGAASASVGTDIMPTEKRGDIGQVKPSGWQTVKYDSIDGKYLYNRCHLIGYQLTGENANEKNLITGTRYLNIEGMLPFENMVADYVKETENHVMYRVTPVFEGDNLVASGVLMEGRSVEDDGDGIMFCVYAYNVQPGISISYADGSSVLAEESRSGGEETADYILNTSTMKFHYPTCSSAEEMNESNKETFTGSRDQLITQGYAPCKRCNP